MNGQRKEGLDSRPREETREKGTGKEKGIMSHQLGRGEGLLPRWGRERAFWIVGVKAK